MTRRVKPAGRVALRLWLPPLPSIAAINRFDDAISD
jgi:hypothetical protein